MPKLMIRIIMSLGAVLLSTAPISQTFAQVKQQEAQTSGIAVADTLSSSATESDNLQLLRPGATAIFPVADSIPVADSAAANATPAPMAKGVKVVLLVVAVIVLTAALLVGLVLLLCAGQTDDLSC